MKIILASGSPRRRELLEQAGYSFLVEVSDADENVTDLAPAAMVEELSLRKASAVAKLHEGEEDTCKIIGSDTIVVLDDVVLGKPADEADARRMLLELSGRNHEVYTGVTVLTVEAGNVTKVEQFHECTQVTMREIGEEEMDRYIASGDPLDKAGAYGIQGPAARFISGIHGDYYNVVGLPVCHLVTVLESM